jgi:hypothetical protein
MHYGATVIPTHQFSDEELLTLIEKLGNSCCNLVMSARQVKLVEEQMERQWDGSYKRKEK